MKIFFLYFLEFSTYFQAELQGTEIVVKPYDNATHLFEEDITLVLLDIQASLPDTDVFSVTTLFLSLYPNSNEMENLAFANFIDGNHISTQRGNFTHEGETENYSMIEGSSGEDISGVDDENATTEQSEESTAWLEHVSVTTEEVNTENEHDAPTQNTVTNEKQFVFVELNGFRWWISSSNTFNVLIAVFSIMLILCAIIYIRYKYNYDRY